MGFLAESRCAIIPELPWLTKPWNNRGATALSPGLPIPAAALLPVRMITLRFFASLREALGVAQEALALPAGVATVGELRASLVARGGAWERLAASGSLRCAVNQDMADDATGVKDGDEVAFFPPVTGG